MDLNEVFSTDNEMVDEGSSEAEAEPAKIVSDDFESGTTPEKSQDEVVQDEPKSESKQKESNEETYEKENWTFQAVKDERRKRQELERKLEELQSKEQQVKEERPDIFDDQEGLAQSIEAKVQSQIMQAKVELAREMMMDAHSDYEEMESYFLETVAKENPAIAAEVKKSSNPAKFVYENAKKYKAFQEFESVDKMRDKLRAELRAEIEGELKQTEQEKAEKVSGIKPSLAKARATDKDAFQPETLDSIFSR